MKKLSLLRTCEAAPSVARTLHLMAATGKIRTAVYQEREHVVIPVVALMEGVIWPVNASSPEFVPAEELALAPAGWNGRPCMPDHPADGAARISANNPMVLEKYKFGEVFNAEYKDKKLVMEAWLDPQRAEAVGPLALDVIRRARAGEMVEVSVGVFIVTEEKTGEYNGKPYKAIWHNIVPDHLALLPSGTIGACSNDMGCGAPRAASVHVVKDNTYELVHVHRAASAAETPKKTLTEWIREKMRVRGAAQGLSDNDLRQMLNTAVQGIEPGFQGVENVFPEDGTFVYGCYIEGQGFSLYERSYKLKGGEVSVSDKRKSVEPITTYEEVKSAESRAACGCNGGTENNAGGSSMKTRKERVADYVKKLRLKNPKPEVLSAYEAMPEEQFAALETAEIEEVAPAAATTPAPAATTTPTPEEVAAAAQRAAAAAEAAKPKTKTEEEYLAEMPESMRSVFVEHRAAQQARKSELVGKLKTAQAEYTEEQLNAMPIADLEKVARLLKAGGVPIDYTPMTVARSAATADEGVPKPTGIVDSLRAAASATK